MNTELTEAQIHEYRENGFIVIHDFLNVSELEHWRTVTEEAVRERLEATSSLDWDKGLSNQKNPDDYYAQVFVQCLKLADTHAGMHGLMHDPRLGKMAATLAGVDGIRIWHDQALTKKPYSNPTAWHLDNPYWSFYSKDAISIWVALEDATLENGCLYYIPGTHRLASYDNVPIGQNVGDLFKVYPEWKTMNSVACPCKAGSAVFHNGLVAHGAGANMTAGTRRAMACGYMPDGSTFNGQRNVLPPEYFASLKVGDVIDDDAVAPLIWHKHREAVATD